MQVSQIFAVTIQPDIYLWIMQGIGGPPHPPHWRTQQPGSCPLRQFQQVRKLEFFSGLEANWLWPWTNYGAVGLTLHRSMCGVRALQRNVTPSSSQKPPPKYTGDSDAPWLCVLSHFSPVQLFATLWTVAQQTPLPIGEHDNWLYLFSEGGDWAMIWSGLMLFLGRSIVFKGHSRIDRYRL